MVNKMYFAQAHLSQLFFQGLDARPDAPTLQLQLSLTATRGSTQATRGPPAPPPLPVEYNACALHWISHNSVNYQ